jgi:hypothetical protein
MAYRSGGTSAAPTKRGAGPPADDGKFTYDALSDRRGGTEASLAVTAKSFGVSLLDFLR